MHASVDIHLHLRNLLLRCGVFGSAEESMTVKLSRAHKDLKAWCSRNKVACSQPEFTPRMVTWLWMKSVFYLCMCMPGTSACKIESQLPS